MSEVDNPARQFGSDAETQIHSGRLGSSDPAATLHDSGASSASPLGRAGAQESTTFGQYKLIRRLGEGGMGQVWLAEQTTPVQRQVAIKLIRVGIYDAELLQRFRAERQSLAMMDHPAIAKVFDAGATCDGQPYFVMEYVPGVPITEYCDRKHLTIRQRLELLIKVCEGVQHAHQKAIIHRDLKPATSWSRKSTASQCRESSISDWPRRSARRSADHRPGAPGCGTGAPGNGRNDERSRHHTAGGRPL